MTVLLAAAGLFFFCSAAPPDESVGRQNTLDEAFLRLDAGYWAGTLFSQAALSIPETSTAEAISKIRGDGKPLPASPFAPFEGQLKDFVIGVNDLGFVRGAFEWEDTNRSNIAAALKATAVMLSDDPLLLYQLEVGPRVAVSDTGNFIKITDGRMDCLGLPPVDGSTEVIASVTSTQTTGMISSMPEDEEMTTAASSTPSAATSLPPLKLEPAAVLRRIEPNDILLEIRTTDNTSLMIIDHQPTKLIYGHPPNATLALNGTAATWNGRKKNRCRCEINPADRKVQVGDVYFTVKRLMVDCADTDIVELPKLANETAQRRRLEGSSFMQVSSRRKALRRRADDRIMMAHHKHQSHHGGATKQRRLKARSGGRLGEIVPAFAPSLSAATLPNSRSKGRSAPRHPQHKLRNPFSVMASPGTEPLPHRERPRRETLSSFLEQNSRVKWQPVPAYQPQPAGVVAAPQPVMMPYQLPIQQFIPPQTFYATGGAQGDMQRQPAKKSRTLEEEVESRARKAEEQAARQRVSEEGRELLANVYKNLGAKEDPAAAQREAEAAKAQRIAMETDKLRVEHELAETVKQKEHERELQRLEALQKTLKAGQRDSGLNRPRVNKAPEVPRSIYLADVPEIPDIDFSVSAYSLPQPHPTGGYQPIAKLLGAEVERGVSERPLGGETMRRRRGTTWQVQTATEARQIGDADIDVRRSCTNKEVRMLATLLHNALIKHHPRPVPT